MSSDVVGNVDLVDHPIAHVIDSLASGFSIKVHIEHPRSKKFPVGNDTKGKSMYISSESTSRRLTISDMDLFP